MEKLQRVCSTIVVLVLSGMLFQGKAQMKELHVRGAVFDQTNAPVESATITFYSGPVDSAVTKADGSFSASIYVFDQAVKPKMTYRIEKTGYNPFYGHDTIPAADTMDLGKIAIHKIGKLRTIRMFGTVVDSLTNQPVENASLVFYPTVFLNIPQDTCHSDSSGAFSGKLIVEDNGEKFSLNFGFVCLKDGYYCANKTMTADSTDSFSVGTVRFRKIHYLIFPVTAAVVDSSTSDPIENAVMILERGYFAAGGCIWDTLVSDLNGNIADSITIPSDYAASADKGGKMIYTVTKDGFYDLRESGWFPFGAIDFRTIKMLKQGNPMVSIDTKPVLHIPYSRQPNNIRVFSLNGRLLYESPIKGAPGVSTSRPNVAGKTFIVVYRYNTSILYSKKMAVMP